MMNTITARIYWDDQDANNSGWAWQMTVDGSHDDSGPLDGCGDDASDAELIAALRSQSLTRKASELLSDDDIEICR
jgi:hypothetical protein